MTLEDPEDLEGHWDAEALRLRRLRSANWPASVPRGAEASITFDTVVDYLRHWARETPTEIAIAYAGHEVTFAEYDDLSDRVASWLRIRGARPTDRVGVMLDNCPQFAILMLGILKAGCVHVPFSPMARAPELNALMRITEPRVLFCEPRLLPGLAGVANAPHDIVEVAVDALSASPTAPSEERIDGQPTVTWGDVVGSPAVPVAGSAVGSHPDDVAALNFTGGSSGLPRACEHSQRHMVYTARSSVLASGGSALHHPSPVLNSLPLFWIAGEVFGILIPLITGSTSVLLRRWDSIKAIGLIARYRVANYNGLVETYESMLDVAELDPSRLASLTNPRCISFGRRLSSDLRRRWRTATGATLREGGYGMTESHTANTLTLGFQDDDRDLSGPGTFIGFPVPETDAIVVTESGVPCEAGQEGRLLLRGPSVMQGYFRDPASTSEVLHAGWLRTGDRAAVDADGALRFLGRDKELLKVNGMSVHPREIERILLRMPGVSAAAVVGVTDPDRGESPVAFVVCADPELSPESVSAWATQEMSSYKVPRVTLLEALPRTASGKVALTVLKQLASAAGRPEGAL